MYPFFRGSLSHLIILSNETWFYVGWFCFNTELAEKMAKPLQQSQARPTSSSFDLVMSLGVRK